MSIGLLNRDSSFFNVEVPGIKTAAGDFTISNEDIISFTVDEELGHFISGSISLNDPNHYISRILHTGTRLKMDWGYKPSLASMSSFLTDVSAGVFVGRGYRKGITGYVQSPSGSGAADGKVTTNINWFGSESLGTPQAKIYREGTKATVVSEVLQSMGVLPVFQFIDFKRGSETITPTTCPMQWQTDFRFLSQMAWEWGAVFKISEDELGNTIALFSSFGSPLMTSFAQRSAHATVGSVIQIGYKTGISTSSTPVDSYTWQNRMGLDGTGDNVQITMINGKPQFMRYNTQTQSIETWTLNSDRMAAQLDKQSSFSGKAQTLQSWLGAQTFEEVKWAFDKTVATTAPQGAGYTMNLKMIGNPCVTAGVGISFEPSAGKGDGFPDFCYPKKGLERIQWWMRKITHTVDRTGYNMEAEICDAFALNNGLMVH